MISLPKILHNSSKTRFFLSTSNKGVPKSLTRHRVIHKLVKGKLYIQEVDDTKKAPPLSLHQAARKYGIYCTLNEAIEHCKPRPLSKWTPAGVAEHMAYDAAEQKLQDWLYLEQMKWLVHLQKNYTTYFNQATRNLDRAKKDLADLSGAQYALILQQTNETLQAKAKAILTAVSKKKPDVKAVKPAKAKRVKAKVVNNDDDDDDGAGDTRFALNP